VSRESAYVPVSVLAEADDSSLIWRLALPEYAPSEQIMVNVKRLGRLAHLGGMESLRVDGYAGDTTQVAPQVTSVDGQGAATAAAEGSVAKAETHKAGTSGFADPEIPYDYEWTRGAISLNVAELDERVGRRSKLRDPKEWSKQIDRALRAGIRDSSWESLVGKAPLSYKLNGLPFFGSYAAGATITALAVHSGGTQIFETFVGTDLFYCLLYRPLSNKFLLRQRQLQHKDMKHTLVPGPPLDRYLAVNALSRTLPIVKPRSSKRQAADTAVTHN